MESQAKKYNELFGYYPESVHADKIYQNRYSRKFCNKNGIRMIGKPLGRPPPKVTDLNEHKLKEQMQQMYQDYVDRIIVESKFGIAKRKYQLAYPLTIF